MPIDKNGIVYAEEKKNNKKKLNISVLSIAISVFSLIISGSTYLKTFNGNVQMSLGYEGYTSTMFAEDIFEELNGLNESHSVSELNYGVQEIYIDFMNTSKTPIYITDFELYAEIGNEVGNVFYKVDDEKSKGNYLIDYKFYTLEMYGIEVDDFDDELTCISINPGDFCRIYFELKICYPPYMSNYILQHISEGYELNKSCKYDFEERKFLYSLVDSTIYEYIAEKQNICNLIVKYKTNGSNKEIKKRIEFCIIPICAPEGF